MIVNGTVATMFPAMPTTLVSVTITGYRRAGNHPATSRSTEI